MGTKKQIKVGDRIELVYTNDELTDLKPGDRGTVTEIEENQVERLIWVNWDNGERLALIEGIDEFKVVREE